MPPAAAAPVPGSSRHHAAAEPPQTQTRHRCNAAHHPAAAPPPRRTWLEPGGQGARQRRGAAPQLVPSAIAQTVAQLLVPPRTAALARRRSHRAPVHLRLPLSPDGPAG